jgi:hypothetical protein
MKRSTLLSVGIGLLLAGPFCFHVITETDIGWHLAIGRLIAHSGIPRENALAWTAPHEPWYATSWLYDWLAFQLTNRFGVAGLQTLTFLLVGLVVIGVALALQRSDDERGFWWTPAVALALIPRITERPHIVSWVVLAFALWLCIPGQGEPADFEERARRGLGWQRRLACVPLLAVGSNLHAGAVFPALVLALFCAEAWIVSGRWARELGIAAAGGLALLANPGGFFNVQYVLQHIHVQDVIPIVEMMTPTPLSAPVVYASIPVLLVAGWRLRRRSPALVAAALLYMVLTLRAVRFGVELEIVTAILAAQALATLGEPGLRPYRIILPVAAAALVLLDVLPKYRAQEWGHSFEASALPVRAARFVQSEQITGPMFNAFRDGGYLEWILPELQWFQDGRIQAYPEAFFKKELEVDPIPGRFRQWLGDLGVEWAITSRWPEWMTGRLRLDSPEWALVYWDEATEIRVRRDVPRFAPLVLAKEYKHFLPDGKVTVASADAVELVGWEKDLRQFEETSPDFPLAAVLHCVVLKRLGRNAADTCAHAGKIADTKELKGILARVDQLPLAR